MPVGALGSVPRAIVAPMGSSGAMAQPPANVDAGSAASAPIETAAPTPAEAAVGAQPVAAVDGPAAAGGLQPTITDGQDRVFTLQQDPVSGHPQYRHAATQRDETGNQLDLEILID